MLLGLLKGLGEKLIPKLISKILGEGKAIKKAKLSFVLDRNKDGKVNLKDFPGLEHFADINGDGKADFNDLVTLAEKNNRHKLYVAVVSAIVFGVGFYFASKYGLV